MRRAAVLLVFLVVASAAFAQTPRRRHPAIPAPRPVAGPPHAWLFGVWTGGLFPVLDGMTAQDCKAQPTVVFARDTVGHASLLGNALIPRVIETARTTPTGAEFRFTPTDGADAGFGCADPNALNVARADGNRITFPNCAAFPYPLERCPVA